MKIFQPRPKKSPKIYGYTELSPEYDGLIKIGYTEREVKDRMKEHYPTLGPKGIERYKVNLTDSIEFPSKARWPLDSAAPFLKGPGLKF